MKTCIGKISKHYRMLSSKVYYEEFYENFSYKTGKLIQIVGVG